MNSQEHVASVGRSVVRNVLSGGAARIGYLATRFFIPPFVLAHVGLAEYGLWASCFILVSYLGVSTFGISNVYIKFTAEYDARGDYERVNRLVSTGLMVTVPLCILLFLGVAGLWPLVMTLLKVSPELAGTAREVVLIVVGVFLASLALSAFRDALAGMQLIRYVQGVWVISYLIETALIVVLLHNGRGIRGLAEAFLIRNLIEIVGCAFMAFWKLPWLRVSLCRFSRVELRTLGSFGGIVQLQSLVAIFLDSVERAIALPLVGMAGVGLLEIGTKLPTMAVMMPSAFLNAFLPAASYLGGKLEEHEHRAAAIRKFYVDGARYTNLVAAYICAFLTMLPAPILAGWMKQTPPGAVFILVVFGVTTQIHLLTGPGTSILKGIGLPKEEFRYCVTNLLLLAVTLPAARLIAGHWTAQAIAAGVCSATVLASAYFVRHANHLLGVRFKDYGKRVLWPGFVAPYGIALAVSLPSYFLLHNPGRWVAAGYVLVAGLLYTAALCAALWFRIFDANERGWCRVSMASACSQWLPSSQKLRAVFASVFGPASPSTSNPQQKEPAIATLLSENQMLARQTTPVDPAIRPASKQPSVLLVCAVNVSGAARLPLIFKQAGFRVGLMTRPGFTIAQSSCVDELIYAGDSPRQVTAEWSRRLPELSQRYDWMLPCDESIYEELMFQETCARVSHATPFVPGPEMLKVLLSKVEFMQMARTQDIPMPEFQLCATADEARAAAARIGYPAVLKLARSTSGSGVRLIRDAAALELWLEEFHGRGEFLVQRYVKGRAGATTVLMNHGEPVCWFSNFLLYCWPNEFCPSGGGELLDDPQMEPIVRAVGKMTGFHGLCGIDWIQEPGTGEILLLEFNPRATPTIRHGLTAGVDFAQALAAMWHGELDKKQYLQPARGKEFAMYPEAALRALDDRNPALLWKSLKDIPWADRGLSLAFTRRALTQQLPEWFRTWCKDLVTGLRGRNPMDLPSAPPESNVSVVREISVPTPLVSVVITTRNKHHLLSRALASVLEQTYSQLSVTIVDDGSDVPVQYTGNDPRVRVLRNDVPLGLAGARNVGFAATKGAYIAMLDDDDFYLPEKIEQQLAFLQQHPDVDMVFSRVAVQEPSGVRRHYLGREHVHSPEINLRAFNVIHPASCLMHRSVWEQIHFDGRLRRYEDTLFFNLVCSRFSTAFLPADVAVWMLDRKVDELTRVHYVRNFENFRIVCDGLSGLLASDPEASALYYGRLACQALRCFRLGEVLRCLPKIGLKPALRLRQTPALRAARFGVPSNA